MSGAWVLEQAPAVAQHRDRSVVRGGVLGGGALDPLHVDRQLLRAVRTHAGRPWDHEGHDERVRRGTGLTSLEPGTHIHSPLESPHTPSLPKQKPIISTGAHGPH